MDKEPVFNYTKEDLERIVETLDDDTLQALASLSDMLLKPLDKKRLQADIEEVGNIIELPGNFKDGLLDEMVTRYESYITGETDTNIVWSENE